MTEEGYWLHASGKRGPLSVGPPGLLEKVVMRLLRCRWVTVRKVL